eukprot:TRINITY_DN2574_c0_g3_i2.p1 TRINITY_DN2574_c0_g3~~TRINITY_DN2574_c0_g3_i2.p1  ORF type:complete len:427 (+),score=88.33 TRINITY_DN2574_c0_g3_i2:62-1342(+)
MPALQRPLPEVGAEVIVEELPGFGFLALLQQSDDFDTVNVVLDGVSPTRSMQVKPSQVRTYEEALEEGWFPRWEFGHEKEGWRQYALDESYQLEAAYAAWRAKEPGAEDNVTIEGGGKMGSMQIIVAFGASSHFADWPHHAIQMNTASQHVRPVRRTFREASSVDADSKEGWCLSFGSLPVNVVCDVWNEVNDGQLEAAKALTTLQSIAYRKRIAELPEGDARLIARLRYSGPHVDAIAAERAAAGQPPLVAWGWFHGGELREWKAYRGAESRLLERQFQAKSKFVLMNGGKPSDGWPLKPLRVLLNVGWTTRGGRFFAPHVQVDLVSRRRRGVRRQEVSKGTWDYVFFYWLEKFPLLPASSVYGVYDSYLMKLHERGAADGHAALRAEVHPGAVAVAAVTATAASAGARDRMPPFRRTSARRGAR